MFFVGLIEIFSILDVPKLFIYELPIKKPTKHLKPN